MKIDRLIGIITILQQKGKVTAPYLAERFEVSRRTINRDIEEICRAGIPLVTDRGANGGISIMKGFSLDTTVFTREELGAIFTGLQSLDSVSGVPGIRVLAQKIGADMDEPDGEVMIDLSSFYKGSLSEKIRLIRAAIREKRCVSFHYYYKKGEADKLVEPYRVIYHWTAWYLYGYCTERQDFRLYKLNRLWELSVTEKAFLPREIPGGKPEFGKNMTDDHMVAAIYQSQSAYRLAEEYGPDCFRRLEDGRVYAELGFSNWEDAVSYLLSFGSQAEIVGPKEFRELFCRELERIRQIY